MITLNLKGRAKKLERGFPNYFINFTEISNVLTSLFLKFQILE